MDFLTLPDWSLWGLIAMVLIAVEMMTAGYIALGFGVGAALVALIVYVVPGLPIMVQALIWAVTGLCVWLGLSRWNKARHASRRDINDFDSLDSLTPEERRHRRNAGEERE